MTLQSKQKSSFKAKVRRADGFSYRPHWNMRQFANGQLGLGTLPVKHFGSLKFQTSRM